MNLKQNEEQIFHDEIYKTGLYKAKFAQRLRNPFYRLLSESIGEYEKIVINTSNTCKAILEWGGGKDALIKRIPYQPEQLFNVIDISAKAIDLLRDDPKLQHINAVHGDATMSPFPDHYFDMIFGKWILHHLSIEAAVKEMKRILKPNGTAIFIEPMSNPIINIYRKLTPALRTSGEHPLKKKDLKLFNQKFSYVEFQGFHLLWFLAPLLRSTNTIKKITSFEHKLLTRMNFLMPYCWEMIIISSK